MLAFEPGSIPVAHDTPRPPPRREEKSEDVREDVREDVPRMVRRMLMSRSAPQPRSRKTPSGGRMMASRILQISLLSPGQFLVGRETLGEDRQREQWSRREETYLAVKGIVMEEADRPEYKT